MSVIDKKKIGTETIDRHPCIKYDAVFYLKDKPQEKFNSVLWEAQDLGGLPIRNEMAVPESKRMGGSGKMVTELRISRSGPPRRPCLTSPRILKRWAV